MLVQATNNWYDAPRDGLSEYDDSSAATYQDDEAAEALADTPHFTGDPEFDAAELEALDKGIDLRAEYEKYRKSR